jgi:predicted RNase H-like HicB family nuclease
MQKVLFIRAEWDDEANVWVATSDDVPGLATEADTMEALSLKLETLVPELLTENGHQVPTEIAYELLARRFSITHAKVAH